MAQEKQKKSVREIFDLKDDLEPAKTYYTIEKVTQMKHHLYELTVEGGRVKKKLLREDVPAIVQALFLKSLQNAPFTGVKNA